MANPKLRKAVENEFKRIIESLCINPENRDKYLKENEDED
jgi:hypothetical protein